MKVSLIDEATQNSYNIMECHVFNETHTKYDIKWIIQQKIGYTRDVTLQLHNSHFQLMHCVIPIVNTGCCSVSGNGGLCNSPSNGGANSYVPGPVRVFLGMAGRCPVPGVSGSQNCDDVHEGYMNMW